MFWTLFIIVPCFIGMFHKEDRTGNLIGLAIGIVLLLSCQNILDFGMVLKLIIPFILVVWGLSLIFKDTIILLLKPAHGLIRRRKNTTIARCLFLFLVVKIQQS